MSATISILYLMTCLTLGQEIHLGILTNPSGTRDVVTITENVLTNQSLNVNYFVMEREDSLVNLYMKDGVKNSSDEILLFDTRPVLSPYICFMADALGYTYAVTSANYIDKCKTVELRLSITDYIDAAIQIFEYDNQTLSEVVFLLEEKYDLDSSVFQRGDKGVVNIMMFTLRDGNLTSNVQQALTNSDTQIFIIIASYSAIEEFFSKLQRLTIYRHDHWVVVPLDDYHCPTINLTYFSFVCLHHQRLPDDNSELSSAHLPMDLVVYRTFLKFLASFIIKRTASKESDHIQLSELVQVAANDFKTKSDLSILYLTKMHTSNGTVSKKLIGNWTKQNGVEAKTNPFGLVPDLVMSVILIHEPPFVKRIRSGNHTRYEGYTIDVLNEIAKRMKFKYFAKEVPDDQYGVILPDGTWTGIIGEIARGAGDLGAGPISVTAERESVIDFTAPYYDYAGLQILIKDPEKPKSLFVFASAFTEYVWITWACVLFLTAILLFLYHWLQFRRYKKMNAEKVKENPFNLKDSFWFVMASITLAGPERNPVTFSSRLLVAGFWFFCQIMMATYTANLAAFMTSSRLKTPIESLDDLASQSTIKYSALAGSVSETYFVRMANIEDNFYSLWKDMSYYSNSGNAMNDYAVWDYPLGDKYSRILSVINETGFITTSQQGYARVLQEDFAFIQETPMLKYEMSRTCGLMTVGQPFSSKPYAFVLPENSPLVEGFSSTILQLQSETILTNLKEKWWKNGTLKCSETSEENSGLTMNALGGIFIVTAGGCVLGFILLGLELAIHKFQMHRKKKYHHNNSSPADQINSSSRAHLNEEDVIDTVRTDPGDTNSVEFSKNVFY